MFSKQKGEKIYENEAEGLEKIILLDTEDPNSAHVTLIRIADRWIIFFDFRYNKDTARKHIETARQFYGVADIAHQKEFWSPFFDNLFSAAELTAKATLILMPGTGFSKRSRHRTIQSRYAAFADLGNVSKDYKTTLNKLSGLRDKARYLKGDLRPNSLETKRFLENVKAMIDDAERRISQ